MLTVLSDQTVGEPLAMPTAPQSGRRNVQSGASDQGATPRGGDTSYRFESCRVRFFCRARPHCGPCAPRAGLAAVVYAPGISEGDGIQPVHHDGMVVYCTRLAHEGS